MPKIALTCMNSAFPMICGRSAGESRLRGRASEWSPGLGARTSRAAGSRCSWHLKPRRLRGRGTEKEASIQRRLANARVEVERAGEYHYRVINDVLDRAVDELSAIIEKQYSEGD